MKPNSISGKWLRVSLLITFLTSIFLLNACYDDYGLTTEDYDVVLTNYDKEREDQFPDNKTFFLVDSVFHLVDEDKEDDISRRYDQTILNQIKQNMLDFGYVEIDGLPTETNLPDVVVRTAATSSTTYGAIWNPYYPGYGWGGWYYPWYPGGSTTYYSYDTGTLIVDLTDTQDWNPSGDPDQDVKVLWQGIMNGLLQNSTTGTSGRITNSIDQMYIQSPYLNVK